jgi:hypothetical protein
MPIIYQTVIELPLQVLNVVYVYGPIKLVVVKVATKQQYPKCQMQCLI